MRGESVICILLESRSFALLRMTTRVLFTAAGKAVFVAAKAVLRHMQRLMWVFVAGKAVFVTAKTAFVASKGVFVAGEGVLILI